ncbi:AraC family transcriptional regulator [Chryseobacterium sp. 09-1422]|uniref:AraC family transcriptional regulator n=1 Tax=Chryseobacterium kimseyorum TaxID=2984028 RepID=A0ABT3I3T1_9FLAO|nr:AraC family transcriptional regulator [Chryseobacterium kimseyorum]MCW3170729.1 AraC family transcriptional regulator [Chryseobacterium kimseyorum]
MKSIIPIYTLEQFVETNNFELLNKDLISRKVDPDNLDCIELNFPAKINSFSLLLVTAGNVRLNIDFQQITLQRNDIIFLYPSNIIEFLEVSSDTCFQNLFLSVEYFTNLNFQMNSQEALDILSNNFSKVITLCENSALNINHNFDRLSALNNPKNDTLFNREMQKSIVTLVMYELAGYVQKQRNPLVKTFRKEDIALKFAHLVGQHYQTRRDVQFYADQIYVTRTHLTRTIKDVYDKNPKQIIEDKIISEAKILLLKSGISINQVMKELRFDDQPTFTKFFKKKTGYSPNVYRRSLMNA